MKSLFLSLTTVTTLIFSVTALAHTGHNSLLHVHSVELALITLGAFACIVFLKKRPSGRTLFISKNKKRKK